MQELKLMVPTYIANLSPEHRVVGDDPDFGHPDVPVLIREAEGVRIVLGTHDYEDYEKPDIQVERRPNGWAIFLHPLGGSDPSGYVYFLDDGRSFLVPENGCSPTEVTKALGPHGEVPELDRPSARFFVKEDEVEPSEVIEVRMLNMEMPALERPKNLHGDW